MKLSQEGKHAQKARDFIESLWQAKLDTKRTYQEIADETKIPYHTICRFFQGSMNDPGIYTVNEISHALGVPLFSADRPDATAEVEHLETELQHKDELLTEKDRAIARLLDRSRLMESGIEFRENRLTEKEHELHTVQGGSKPLVYGLLSLCVVLAAVLLVYIILDVKNPYQGLIRTGEGGASIIIWGGVSGVIVALIAITHMVVSRWYAHQKNKGES